jgi:hypothetical protein
MSIYKKNGWELYTFRPVFYAPEKILVSGDHGRIDYDEVNAVKKFLKDKYIPGGGYNESPHFWWDRVYREEFIQ